MKKIIIDTDMGPDCDDAGALAIANQLHKSGRIRLLGVTHCTSEEGGAYTIAAINRRFSNEEIPIGQTERKGFLDGKENRTFTDAIKASYLEKYGTRSFEAAVPMLRRLLAENRDVTLICIGPLNNLANLLKSPNDDAVPLSGLALAARSLSSVVVMGGDFRKEAQEAEYNIRCDIESAKYAAAHCPAPVTYCGYEMGKDVLCGESLREYEASHPVRQAYQRFLEKYGQKGSFLRPSWDLIAVCYGAGVGRRLWEVCGNLFVRVDAQGRTRTEKGGKDGYLVNAAGTDRIASALEELLKMQS